MSDQVISYGPRAKPLRKHSLDVLRSIMRVSGIDFLIVSSTARTVEDQARIMFANLQTHGVDSQRMLYGPFGDQVITVYSACQAKKMAPDAIRAAMECEIRRIGAHKVSKHCADPDVLEVFDVSPASLRPANRVAFERAVRDEKRVSKFLTPAAHDPAYHFEVPQKVA